MSQVSGLYISVDKTGKIKRSLTTQSGETKLKATTIQDELILFSELNFGPYAQVVEMLTDLSEQIEINDAEHFGEVDMKIYQEFLQKTEMLISLLKEESPIQGVLTETLLDDCTTPDDGTAIYIYETKDIIIDCLSQAIELHFYINMLFNDLRMDIPLDIENKYSFLMESEYTQIFTYANKFTMKYRFRSIAGYYTFLLIRFISSRPNIARCECCGRYFIPKTKKKTLYCDRIIKGGKSCKQLAPGLKHKLAARNSRVIEEYDRANQRMYKRYDRVANFDQKPTDITLTYAEYYKWRDAATTARDEFLDGRISEKEALRIIMQ